MATLLSFASSGQPTASPTGSNRADLDDYAGPNLHVLIPVIIVFGVIAFVFFGWLGLPWHMLRKQNLGPRPVTIKPDPVVDEELELEGGHGACAAADHNIASEPSPMGAVKVGGEAFPERYDRDDLRCSYDALPEPPTPWDPTRPDAARLRM